MGTREAVSETSRDDRRNEDVRRSRRQNRRRHQRIKETKIWQRRQRQQHLECPRSRIPLRHSGRIRSCIPSCEASQNHQRQR